MNRKIVFVATLIVLISMLSVAFKVQMAKANGTIIAVINPETGGNEFTFPPGTPIGTTFVANITITNVVGLAGWQLNLTWDPMLLEIAISDDIYRPSDAIFGATGMPGSKILDSGKVFWTCLKGMGDPDFTGNGTLCQIIFTTVKSGPEEPTTCDIAFDLISPFPTTLSDGFGLPIVFIVQNGLYEILKPIAIISVVNPETGTSEFILPPGTPIGTTFVANITITNVVGLAGWQLNLTWDPMLLEIAISDDIYRPSDAIFGATGMEGTKIIDPHQVFWTVVKGMGDPDFTGNGTLCQIIFTTVKNATGEPTTCDIAFDLISPFPTALSDSIGSPIEFTVQNGSYEILRDTTPPTVYILSPENKTYSASDVPLTFTVDEVASWTGYSLDGVANVTEGNTTLSGLDEGSHYVVVYANDTVGNMGASSMVYFTVDTTPPNITDVSQIPLETNVLPEDEVEVNATVTDALSGVKQVTLNYTNGDGTWITVDMTYLEGNIWNGTIPSFPYCTNVTYVIIAEDNAGHTTTTPMGYEYQYHVIPEFPSLIILPLFMIATLLVFIVYRRRHRKIQ